MVQLVFYYYYVGFDQTEHNSNSNDAIVCQDFFENYMLAILCFQR